MTPLAQEVENQNQVWTQESLFNPRELERLSHPYDYGFFALLFPHAAKETKTDAAAIQGKIFQHLPDEDAATAATIHLGDGPRPLAAAIDIAKQGAAGKKRPALAQRCFGLQYLEPIVAMCQGRAEHYLSQGDFERPNRQAINLLRTSSVWLDLDIYDSPMADMMHDESLIAQLLRRHCEMHGIPLPSVIMRSGMGYYLKWFTEALPALAWRRVRATMVHLVDLFDVFGADPTGTDASRVLRVGGSMHSTSGDTVRIIWKNEITEYAFDGLANAILPVYRTYEQAIKWQQGREIQKKELARARELDAFYKSLPYDPRIKRAHLAKHSYGDLPYNPRSEALSKVVETLAFQPENQQQALWWSRLLDMKTLIQIRGDNLKHREVWMFLMMNALAWSGQATPENFYDQAREIGKLMPRQDKKAIHIPEQTLGTLYNRTVAALKGELVTHEGEEVSQLYRYKNSTLIEKLGITSDEMTKLFTLIDSKEIRRRKIAHQEEVRRAAGSVPRAQYEAEQAERRGHAVRLRESGLSWAKVGEIMGIKADAARMLAARG